MKPLGGDVWKIKAYVSKSDKHFEPRSCSDYLLLLSCLKKKTLKGFSHAAILRSEQQDQL